MGIGDERGGGNDFGGKQEPSKLLQVSTLLLRQKTDWMLLSHNSVSF